MHAQELIEVAAMAAWQAPAMLRSGCQLGRPGVARYELASRRRQSRWLAELESIEAGRAEPSRLRSVLEEILTGELLTRTWGAVLTAHDSVKQGEYTRSAQRVLVGHVEAGNQALALLLDSPRVTLEQAANLNRLRRRCERWADLLLAPLIVGYHVSDFAVDPRRAREFAGESSAERAIVRFQQAWPLTSASLKAAFWNELAAEAANPDLNRVIGQSVLASFSPELFDGTGSPHSLWTIRLLNSADDAQWLVEHLAEIETIDRPLPAALRQAAPRFRT